MNIQSLNDEELIYQARYINVGILTKNDKRYLQQRLQTLGYTVEFGCCGQNNLRYTHERQSHISKNE
jgi:hypothetical protein